MGMEQHSDRFHVQVSVGDHVVGVRAAGEVDIATVGAFRAALWAAPARPVLRLDLSGVRLLSAAGVRALVAAHLRVRARGGELVLVDPTPVVARVLRVTGLHRVIPVPAVAADGRGRAAARRPRPTAWCRPPDRATAGARRGRRRAAGGPCRATQLGQRTPSRSTTKTRVSPGLMTPPAPRLPYPRCGGMVSRRRPPTSSHHALVPAGDDLPAAERELEASPRFQDASNSPPVEWATPT